MRILILDDIEDRHIIFAQYYKGNEITHSYNYNHFCDYLNDGIWDIIHLDHDLGDFENADSYIDGWGNTQQYNGTHAAIKVCEMENSPSKVIIHSVNAVGSKNMLNMLQSANINVTWQPFGNLLIK